MIFRQRRILWTVLLFTCGLCTRVEAAGATAFVSREFDQWPSTAALGSAAVSSLDPFTALWVNPAALSFSPGQIGAMHSEWLEDTRMEQVAIALGGTGTIRFGISSHLVTTDNIPLRDIPSVQPLGFLEARDFGLGLSAAFRPDSSLSLGLTARLLTQQVYTDNASTFGFDLGVIWLQSSRLRLAASVNNLGRSISWGDGTKAPLPRSFRAGASFQMTGSLTASADMWMIRDRDARGAFGLEWRPTPAMSVRSGYLAGADSRNISAGFGLHWRDIGFDYAIIPLSNSLGTTHRVAIRYVPSLRR